MEQLSVSARIHQQIFQLMCDPYLKRFLLFMPLTAGYPYELRLHVRHCVSNINQIISQQIIINYPTDYPKNPPVLKVVTGNQVNPQIPQIVLKCSQIQPENWRASTSLIKIIKNLVEFIDLYWQSYYGFGKNIQLKFIKNGGLAHSQANHKNHNNQLINNNESALEKVLMLRLQQIVKDVHQQSYEECQFIINLYKSAQIAFSNCFTQLLKNTVFRNELAKQLQDGRWVHKILKSSTSLKLKKRLIFLQNELMKEIQFVKNQDQSRMDEQIPNN